MKSPAPSEWERHAARCRVRAAVARDYPLPGVLRSTYPIPTTWGEPTFAYRSRAYGRYPVEVMNFANGERVTRLLCKVSGFDDPDGGTASPSSQRTTT